jgi:hypothetical protein
MKWGEIFGCGLGIHATIECELAVVALSLSGKIQLQPRIDTDFQTQRREAPLTRIAQIDTNLSTDLERPVRPELFS